MTTLPERVVAAAPRVYIDRSPAADPADRAVGTPAAAACEVAAAAGGIGRRRRPRRFRARRPWAVGAQPRELQVGDVVEVPSRAVRCSRCEEPTGAPVFMGVTDDGARLPLWWCADCKARVGATS